MSEHAPIGVYRAPMRTRRVDDGAAAEWAIAAGMVGLAGELGTDVDDAVGLDEALMMLEERAARRLLRFAQTPSGSYVWTRDQTGGYRLGRIAGSWRHDSSAEAARWGLQHQRPCLWQAAPVPDALVPVAVLQTFARGGRNWQRIRAESALPDTVFCWSRASDR